MTSMYGDGMPYHPPSIGGLIREQLVVRADGTVEIDGERRGWISRLDLRSVTRSRPGVTETEIAFEMVVVPERHMAEPDAVFDMGGRHIGYSAPNGEFIPLQESP